VSAWKRRHELVKVDAHQVAKRLWVGSRPPFDMDLPRVDVLVLCAQEIQVPRGARVAFHGEIIGCPLPDAELTHAQLKRALDAAHRIAVALAQRKARVLVTCAAGLNRSAFVAALALGRLTKMRADDLVSLVRRRRSPDALSNPHLVTYLHRIVDLRHDVRRPARSGG